jgi:hypothetical protein
MCRKATALIAAVVASVVLALGASYGVIANHAGAQFQARLSAMNHQDLGSPILKLTDVKVDRGLLSSKATGNIEVLIPGSAPVLVPVSLQTSQGPGMDGSAMRVHAQMGVPDNPKIARLMAGLHDAQPISAEGRFNLAGQPTAIQVVFAPANGTLPGPKPLQVSWGGGKLTMAVNGYFAPSGGTVMGTSNVEPLTLTGTGLHLNMGPMDETFSYVGTPLNEAGQLHLTLGQSGAGSGGPKDFMLKFALLDAHFAVKRTGTGQAAGNPSGLAQDGLSVGPMSMVINMAKPQGKISMEVHFDGPLPQAAASQVSPQAQVQAQLQALARARAELDILVSRSLLDQLPAAQVEGLEKQGILRIQGDNASVDVVLADQRVAVNGQPLPR